MTRTPLDRMETFAALFMQGMLAAADEGEDEALVDTAWHLAGLMETRAIQRREKIQENKTPAAKPTAEDPKREEKKEYLRKVLIDYGARPSKEDRVEFSKLASLMRVHMNLSDRKACLGISSKKMPEYLDLIEVEYDNRGAKLKITNEPTSRPAPPPAPPMQGGAA